MPLALCIVGCGQFARTLPTACNLCGTRSTSFASRDLARARAYAALFQGRGAFGSYAAAAADPRWRPCTRVPLTTCIRPTSPWPPRRASTSWWRNPRPHPG